MGVSLLRQGTVVKHYENDTQAGGCCEGLRPNRCGEACVDHFVERHAERCQRTVRSAVNSRECGRPCFAVYAGKAC